MKLSVDRREDDLPPTSSAVPRIHLAGAVPVMPGLAPVTLSSPTKRSNGYHGTNGNNQSTAAELAEAIDGIQLNSGRLQHTPVIPLNGGVGETVTVQRSEPKIESEFIEDENGKLIKRTTKRTQVVTTKTYSERYINPELLVLPCLPVHFHPTGQVYRLVIYYFNSARDLVIFPIPERVRRRNFKGDTAGPSGHGNYYQFAQPTTAPPFFRRISQSSPTASFGRYWQAVPNGGNPLPQQQQQQWYQQWAQRSFQLHPSVVQSLSTTVLLSPTLPPYAPRRS
ncbi:unnamed protein product [Rodentolepis nana]|uniref:DM5 domain-containing protein n=1 Tax=Rodentolepis nana TaxID=102285 RepID=A0A0R3T895_RODNA|nr:unnamed protein product [Rodentolepis nana]